VRPVLVLPAFRKLVELAERERPRLDAADAGEAEPCFVCVARSVSKSSAESARSAAATCRFSISADNALALAIACLTSPFLGCWKNSATSSMSVFVASTNAC
jgi:hypothetical protein